MQTQGEIFVRVKAKMEWCVDKPKNYEICQELTRSYKRGMEQSLARSLHLETGLLVSDTVSR